VLIGRNRIADNSWEKWVDLYVELTGERDIFLIKYGQQAIYRKWNNGVWVQIPPVEPFL
jgi:hypothetical protein